MDPEESSVDSKLPIVVEAPVAPFVQQLFKMVNSNTLIQWSEDGLVIEVPDPARFAAEICPLYFRHKNWNSFARMMNMYQFAKLPNEPKSKNARFSHPSFRRDGGDLLWKITRQKTATVPRKKKKKEEGDSPSSSAGGAQWLGAPLATFPQPELTAEEAGRAALLARDSCDIEAWVKRAIALERRVTELEQENAVLRRVRNVSLGDALGGPDEAKSEPIDEEARRLNKELSEDSRTFLLHELTAESREASFSLAADKDATGSRKRKEQPRRGSSTSSRGSIFDDTLAGFSDILGDVRATFGCNDASALGDLEDTHDFTPPEPYRPDQLPPSAEGYESASCCLMQS